MRRSKAYKNIYDNKLGWISKNKAKNIIAYIICINCYDYLVSVIFFFSGNGKQNCSIFLMDLYKLKPTC